MGALFATDVRISKEQVNLGRATLKVSENRTEGGYAKEATEILKNKRHYF